MDRRLITYWRMDAPIHYGINQMGYILLIVIILAVIYWPITLSAIGLLDMKDTLNELGVIIGFILFGALILVVIAYTAYGIQSLIKRLRANTGE